MRLGILGTGPHQSTSLASRVSPWTPVLQYEKSKHTTNSKTASTIQAPQFPEFRSFRACFTVEAIEVNRPVVLPTRDFRTWEVMKTRRHNPPNPTELETESDNLSATSAATFLRHHNRNHNNLSGKTCLGPASRHTFDHISAFSR